MKKILSLITAASLSVLLASAHILAASAPVPDATKSVSGGGVTVKVTYLEQTEHESRFLVALDTHSVNLETYDFKSLALIRDDTGMSMPPTGVVNKGGGHHREIVVTFARPSNDRKWLEVVIKDVGGVKERVFRWDR